MRFIIPHFCVLCVIFMPLTHADSKNKKVLNESNLQRKFESLINTKNQFSLEDFIEAFKLSNLNWFEFIAKSPTLQKRLLQDPALRNLIKKTEFGALNRDYDFYKDVLREKPIEVKNPSQDSVDGCGVSGFAKIEFDKTNILVIQDFPEGVGQGKLKQISSIKKQPDQSFSISIETGSCGDAMIQVAGKLFIVSDAGEIKEVTFPKKFGDFYVFNHFIAATTGRKTCLFGAYQAYGKRVNGKDVVEFAFKNCLPKQNFYFDGSWKTQKENNQMGFKDRITGTFISFTE
ncbi:MAG: hypothetical protein JNM39_03945 [Bdellovibrionaceae bacterium]|nr:hypothetical protein [Pseudobdellovibrionaceae bacterium]